MTETVRLIQSSNLKIPLFLSFVRVSFPSPADDYKERPLDLDELVIQHPEATFYVRVSGESMQDAGIDDGDVLVVDRAIDARHNAIIVAILNGKFTVKRLHQEKETTYLVPANAMYKPVRVTEDMNFQVWGVVKHCIRKVNDPRLKHGGLCLSSTATRNIFADVPLWLHRLTHQGQLTTAPCSSSPAGRATFS